MITNLKLRKGAQVMFTKNDGGQRSVNGTIGHVAALTADSNVVRTSQNVYEVPKEKWEALEYEYDPTKTRSGQGWSEPIASIRWN